MQRENGARERNRLRELRELGQRAWFDHIERGLLESGELADMIARFSLGGLTSNPTIFAAAFSSGPDYDADIERFARQGLTTREIYDRVVLADIASAAELFAAEHERSAGMDGYVSVEVSPYLAADTAGTIAEAERFWRSLARRNVMIKVPGTPEGVPAVRELIARGVNVNVTLLFSLERYREAADAYIEGLEQAAAAGTPLGSVASVASFFLSRVDVAVDPRLEVLIAERGQEAQVARSLRGEIAIASAKRAYAMYKQLFTGKRFAKLAAKGARPQRLLWASTGTKNPNESDVKYVDALIGPDTINTMPLKTLLAFADHGDPAPRLEENTAEAAERLKRLGSLGIDLAEVTARLLDEGVVKFQESYDAGIAAIEEKRAAAAAAQ